MQDISEYESDCECESECGSRDIEVMLQQQYLRNIFNTPMPILRNCCSRHRVVNRSMMILTRILELHTEDMRF